MSYPDKTMVIMRGNPGSLKSTTAEMLAKVGWGGIASADKYPPLYEGGVYNVEHQKDAHEWAQKEAATMCLNQYPLVIIDNTNIRLSYMTPYEEIAKEFGYHILYLHNELALDPSGYLLPSSHVTNSQTLAQIRDRNNNTYLPKFEQPEPLTIEEMKEMMTVTNERNLFVMADVMGTLIKPKEGADSPFMNKVEHCRFDMATINRVLHIAAMSQQKTLYLLSNQVGIGYGHMSLDDLDKIYLELENKILNMSSILNRMAWVPDKLTIENIVIYTATERAANYVYAWESSGPMAHEFRRQTVTTSTTAKPAPGMLEYAISDAICSDLFKVGDENIIYIGDAHVPGRNEDLMMIRNFNTTAKHKRTAKPATPHSLNPVSPVYSYKPTFFAVELLESYLSCG